MAAFTVFTYRLFWMKGLALNGEDLFSFRQSSYPIFDTYFRTPQNYRQLACHAGTTLEWLVATRNRRTSSESQPFSLELSESERSYGHGSGAGASGTS
jgi:hypothetical protein